MLTAVAPMTRAVRPNWKAAADAAERRRAELGITQEQVIERMGEVRVGVEAYRRFTRLEQNTYRRSTLAAISIALGWEPDALYRIANDDTAPAHELDAIREQISALAATIEAVAERVAQIEEAVRPASRFPTTRRRGQ